MSHNDPITNIPGDAMSVNDDVRPVPTADTETTP
jgi:hypothetical protein